MSLLLYCVTDSSATLDSQTGVARSRVEQFVSVGLAIFYSESPSPDLWLKAPIRSSAQEFHRVQRDLFHSGSLIPFRFPTILDNHNKLREHLNERAATYKGLLHRFANLVQMDFVFSQSIPPQVSPSGSQYLRERQSRHRGLEQTAERLRPAAGTLIHNWRQRMTPNGLRCFALVERKRVEELNEKMKMLSLPEGIMARISGPWPVAEFLDLKI